MKLLFSCLALVLLATSVQAEKECEYKSGLSEKKAKESLALTVKIGMKLKSEGNTKGAKECLKVAESYMKDIPGEAKEKKEALKEVKKALS